MHSKKLHKLVIKIKFALLPDVSIGTWDDFKVNLVIKIRGDNYYGNWLDSSGLCLVYLLVYQVCQD